MSPSGKIRDGVRQGRADAGSCRREIRPWNMAWEDHGIRWTSLRDRHGSVHHEDSETSSRLGAKACRLGEQLAGNSVDRLAGLPAGRPHKTAPQAPSVPTPPMAKESERPSEDASDRRSAKAQDLNPPTVPHVIRVPRAADTENEPSSSSSRPMETEDRGARDNAASDDRSQAPAPAPSTPIEQTDRRSRQQPVSSGVKENLDARLKLKAAESICPGSQHSYLRATRTRIDADTIHIAPRETSITNVLDILGLGDNNCKPMPTPIVQTRQKSDQDEVRLGEEDR